VNTTTATLRDELAAVDFGNFHRPALPSIFAEYAAFMETGRYPYNDDVANFIIDRHALPIPGRWHAVHVTDPLGKALHREVYLASGQWTVGEMRAREADYIAQGYDRPITELEPVEGLRIAVADMPPVLRCKRICDQWALCPPRHRNGFSLAELQAKHRAYERTKEENQTRTNGPRVVMYRVER
jgi:hypothetical protein